MHLKRKKPCIKINDHNNKQQNEENNELSKSYPKLSTKMKINEVIYPNLSKVIQNDETIYKCLLCHKNFKYCSGLSKHKKQKHPNYNEEIKNIKAQNNNDINDNNKIEILEKENQEINTQKN